MSAVHDALNKAAKQKRARGAKDSRSQAPVEIAIPPSFDTPPKPKESGTDGPPADPIEIKGKGPWPVWVASGLAMAGIFASVLLFVAKEGEKQLRKDSQEQLTAALEELAIAQTKFSDLAMEKTELEKQFYANIEEFEKTVRESDGKIERLAERARRLAVLSKSLRREARVLRDTSLSKDRTIELLMSQATDEPALAETGSR